jgi:enterochelin esterase family protein
MKRIALLLILAAAAFAQSSPLDELIAAARKGPGAPGLKDLITKTLSPRGGQTVWGQDYLFVADSQSPVTVSIDQQPAVPMAQIEGSTLWMLLTKMRTGVTHSYQYYAAGKPLGARGDAVGYNPDSYAQPGVPRGKVSEKQTIVSKIYDGMKADYWVYASPGVDPSVPAALMVWQDGQGLIGEYARMRLSTVTENLVHQKLIPPMVHVMIAPGQSPENRPMRPIEYDTVSDRYARFLMEEVLPEVEKTYKLRQDGYSRAIAGESSGGICAFNVAWVMPDKFSRVHSAVGSFTSIQWRPQEKLEGAQHPRVDERRRRRSGKRARFLADAKYSNGEFAQAAGIRLSLPLRHGGPRRSAGFSRFARVAGLAMAGLRSIEDQTGVSDGPG